MYFKTSWRVERVSIELEFQIIYPEAFFVAYLCLLNYWLDGRIDPSNRVAWLLKTISVQHSVIT